jgi:hypothetical protein
VPTELDAEAKEKKLAGIPMDTSPFDAGGTHSAWCAANALAIPVRLDEHPLDSLESTLDLLSNPRGDFNSLNDRGSWSGNPKGHGFCTDDIWIEESFAVKGEHSLVPFWRFPHDPRGGSTEFSRWFPLRLYSPEAMTGHASS